MPKNKYGLKAAFATAAMGVIGYAVMPSSLIGVTVGLGMAIGWQAFKNRYTWPKFDQGLRESFEPATTYMQNLVDDVAQRAGLPPENRPEVVTITDNPAIYFSSIDVIGLHPRLFQQLSSYSVQEQQAIVAHELRHRGENDLRSLSAQQFFSQFAFFGFAAGTLLGNAPGSNVWATLASFIAVSTTMPLLTLYCARQQEFSADHESARQAGTGQHMASALDRIHNGNIQHVKLLKKALGIPEDPKPSTLKSVARNLTRTHPPVNERIRALEKLQL